RVEYTLRYDKGEPPRTSGWTERCPSCGQYHYSSSENYVKEERPYEIGGLLISPTHVLTKDPILHPRFLKSIAVRAGDTVVEAKIARFLKDQPGIILELSQPIEGATPLAFADKPEPHYTATYTNAQGDWLLDIKPFSPVV